MSVMSKSIAEHECRYAMSTSWHVVHFLLVVRLMSDVKLEMKVCVVDVDYAFVVGAHEGFSVLSVLVSVWCVCL